MAEPVVFIKEKPLGKRVLLFFIKILIASFILATAIGGYLGYKAVKRIVADAPDIHTVDFSPKGFATYIYDADGDQIQKLVTTDSNRTAVSITQVPEHMQHAIVAIEDERFYRHNGIDIKGIMRAFVNGLMHGLHFYQGGSTITQQLLKNNVFVNWTEEKTTRDRLTRKIQEQYLAIQLEKELKSKDLILENYLNTINLGAGTYGVEAAARKYFDKDVWNLSLSESAVIAAIPKNPSRYNPITHPERNAERRERVLKKMLKQKYITEEEYETALNDDVYERIRKAQQKASSKSEIFSWFVDALTEQVVHDLQEQKGYSETEAYRLLYSGGLHIYTTQDQNVQKICDEEYANPDNFPKDTEYSIDWALSVQHKDGSVEHFSKEMMRNWYREKQKDFKLTFRSEQEGHDAVDAYKKAIVKETDTVIAERCSFSPQPQSSLVVMDQANGYVKALVGGRGDKQASLTLDRATKTMRQPGSTFKVLSAYAESIETGKKYIGSVVDDSFYMYKNHTEVHNSDNRHRGPVTIRKAIEDSINVPAVKVITETGIDFCFARLARFGFTTLNMDQDSHQALVLGGIYNGVTNLELTAAYAAIANGGIYTKPVFYTKIIDRNGDVLINNTAETHRVISEDTAWILTDAMKGVLKKGTGTAAALTNKVPAAGKTGTTTDYRDLWFVGYTPYYTMGIWAGYDNNEPMPDDAVYREYHKKLWGSIMSRLTDGKDKKKDFEKPESVRKMRICGISGMKPSSSCRHVTNDYVSDVYRPSAVCDTCQKEKTDYVGETEKPENTEEAENAEENEEEGTD